MFWAFVITSFLSIDKENTALVKIFGYNSICLCAQLTPCSTLQHRATRFNTGSGTSIRPAPSRR